MPFDSFGTSSFHACLYDVLLSLCCFVRYGAGDERRSCILLQAFRHSCATKLSVCPKRLHAHSRFSAALWNMYVGILQLKIFDLCY